jgi:hypothetical protein
MPGSTPRVWYYCSAMSIPPRAAFAAILIGVDD